MLIHESRHLQLLPLVSAQAPATCELPPGPGALVPVLLSRPLHSLQKPCSALSHRSLRVFSSATCHFQCLSHVTGVAMSSTCLSPVHPAVGAPRVGPLSDSPESLPFLLLVTCSLSARCCVKHFTCISPSFIHLTNYYSFKLLQ